MTAIRWWSSGDSLSEDTYDDDDDGSGGLSKIVIKEGERGGVKEGKRAGERSAIDNGEDQREGVEAHDEECGSAMATSDSIRDAEEVREGEEGLRSRSVSPASLMQGKRECNHERIATDDDDDEEETGRQENAESERDDDVLWVERSSLTT